MVNPFNNESILIKQSPVVIIKNFILFEFVAIAAFFIAGAIVHFAAIYRTFSLSQAISFHLAELVFIFAGQTLLIFYIFLRWYKNYYDIKKEKIVHGWGIMFRHHEVIPFQSFEMISYRQGPLAKLLKYGTIKLVGVRTIYLIHIPDPQKYVDLIMQLKRTSLGQQLSGNHSDNAPSDVNNLLVQPERENLEFKSSFRWDLKEKKINRGLEKAAMKTIAAFLNSDGGNLVIGVDDKKNVVGMHHDYKTLPRPNADNFENHFSQVFHSMIGPEFRQFVSLSSHKVGESEVCLVNVSPSKQPAYLKSDGSEEFYIRTGNKTTSLKFSEASSYIDSKRFV